MAIVNQTVPRALRKLGYSEIESLAIEAYIDENKSIVAPRAFTPSTSRSSPAPWATTPSTTVGHVKMMGAVQPFISGAISKTVEHARGRHHRRRGEPAHGRLEIGREGRRHLPRTTARSDNRSRTAKTGRRVHLVGHRDRLGRGPNWSLASSNSSWSWRSRGPRVTTSRSRPCAKRMPRRRVSTTFAFRVADCEGYVTVGEYEDGRPGEVFIKVSKQGSTLAGIMDAFSISISLGLQHGVPLATLRAQVREHEVRAVGHDRRRRSAHRDVAGGLHLPPLGVGLLKSGANAKSWACSPPVSAFSPRCPRSPSRRRRRSTSACSRHSST